MSFKKNAHRFFSSGQQPMILSAADVHWERIVSRGWIAKAAAAGCGGAVHHKSDDWEVSEGGDQVTESIAHLIRRAAKKGEQYQFNVLSYLHAIAARELDLAKWKNMRLWLGARYAEYGMQGLFIDGLFMRSDQRKKLRDRINGPFIMHESLSPFGHTLKFSVDRPLIGENWDITELDDPRWAKMDGCLVKFEWDSPMMQLLGHTGLSYYLLSKGGLLWQDVSTFERDWIPFYKKYISPIVS